MVLNVSDYEHQLKGMTKFNAKCKKSIITNALLTACSVILDLQSDTKGAWDNINFAPVYKRKCNPVALSVL